MFNGNWKEKKIDEHKKKVKNLELFCSGKGGPRGHTKRANDIPLAWGSWPLGPPLAITFTFLTDSKKDGLLRTDKKMDLNEWKNKSVNSL